MMAISGISYAQTISTNTVASAKSDFCCNDPACSCVGGKQVKDALQAQQRKQQSDEVRLSQQAQNLLAAETINGNHAAITARSVPPVGGLHNASGLESATHGAVALPAGVAPSTSQNANPDNSINAATTNARNLAAYTDASQTKPSAVDVFV